MYALIQNGNVILIQDNPPEIIDTSDGGCITGFHLADDATKLGYGWYPIVDSRPTTTYDMLDGPVYTINDTTVTATYTGRSFNPDELNSYRTTKIKSLMAMRWTKASRFNYQSYTNVDSGDQAQSRLTSLVVSLQLSGSTSTTVNWEMNTGVFETMTMNDLVAFGFAMGTYVQSCWAHYSTLLSNINSATDSASIDAVDITQGWP